MYIIWLKGGDGMENPKNAIGDMIRVLKRGGFSERKGLVKINNSIQKESLDERTRIALVNVTSALFEKMRDNSSYSKIDDYVKYLYCEVLNKRSNEIPYGSDFYGADFIDYSKVYGLLDQIITNNPYEDVLTLIESITEYFHNKSSYIYNTYSIQEVYNNVFQRECVGYRLINGIMTDCIDEIEISELTHALESPFHGGAVHIEKSMRLLFDRDNPDFENSIKESITAVEAVCQVIAGKKTTLSNVLDMITKKGISIHPALKSAFEKIYGYTSDAKGIRHADGFGGVNSTFEEARYMLVSCSAFKNYLVAIYDKSK